MRRTLGDSAAQKMLQRFLTDLMDSVHTSLETIIIDNQLYPEGYSVYLTSNFILQVQKCKQPASGRLCFLSQIRCLLTQLLGLL